MPKVSYNTKPKSKNKPQVTSITCLTCGETKKSSDFYTSSSVFHAGTGRVPYCKVCLKNMSTDENGNIDTEKFKKVLKEIDKPYLYDILQSAYNEAKKVENGDVIGIYYKNINSLPQNKNLGWADSIFEPQHESENKTHNLLSNFVLTDDIVEFFGAGYEPEEYQAMYRKYNFLKNNYPEKTNMHIEALKTYVRYKVKEEFSSARNDVGSAGKWADLANKAAQNAKINPSQLSAADLADGLSTFGQLVRAVEQAVDIIPILPKFKEKPQDKVDFALWCYINYIRDLKGLPLCEYKDIYKFYEDRKKEHENRFEFLQDKEESIEDAGDE